MAEKQGGVVAKRLGKSSSVIPKEKPRGHGREGKSIAGVRSSIQAKKKSRTAPDMLFLFDQRCFDALRPGHAPRVPYSHDLNLIQFAHEALRSGAKVHFARTLGAALSGQVLSVEKLFPRLHARPVQMDMRDADFVFSSGIEQLNVRGAFPKAKVVAFAPAMHMIEAPFDQTPQNIISWINAARYHIDYFITQNDRMKDILRVLVHWLARWDPSDRILVAPLGYAPEDEINAADVQAVRSRLGIGPKDVLIANAGGAWPWTDCDTLIEAAMEFFRRRPNSRLRFYFPGLTQKDNRQANNVVKRIRAMQKANPDFFGKEISDGKPITIEGDWIAAGKRLPDILAASDIGLSVNRETLEGWQSHRVRMIDYAAKGLAIIATSESELFERLKPGIFAVHAEDLSSYLAVFEKLELRAEEVVPAKKIAVQKAAMSLRTDRTYQSVLRKILVGETRDTTNLEASVIDEEIFQVVEQIRRQVSGRLDEIWSV